MMSTMLSWHKVGQKVTMIDSRVWNALKGAAQEDEPKYGCVYSICNVCFIGNCVYFQLKAVSDASLFDAASFVPVYPAVIEQLRAFEVPSPEYAVRETEPAMAS